MTSQSIPVSAVPQTLIYLQGAILGQIEAAGDPTAPNVEIVMGNAPPMDLTTDIIEVGKEVRRTEAHLQHVGSGGQFYLEETFEIDVFISCWTGSGVNDPEPVNFILNRVWTLIGYVETAVRSNLTMGGTVFEGRPLRSTGGIPEWSDDPMGVLCEATVTINCWNSI